MFKVGRWPSLSSKDIFLTREENISCCHARTILSSVFDIAFDIDPEYHPHCLAGVQSPSTNLIQVEIYATLGVPSPKMDFIKSA